MRRGCRQREMSKKNKQAGGRVLFQEGRCDSAFVRLERHGLVLFSADAQDNNTRRAKTGKRRGGREEAETREARACHQKVMIAGRAGDRGQACWEAPNGRTWGGIGSRDWASRHARLWPGGTAADMPSVPAQVAQGAQAAQAGGDG